MKAEAEHDNRLTKYDTFGAKENGDKGGGLLQFAFKLIKGIVSKPRRTMGLYEACKKRNLRFMKCLPYVRHVICTLIVLVALADPLLAADPAPALEAPLTQFCHCYKGGAWRFCQWTEPRADGISVSGNKQS
jgi:hypothetical protein